jgi:hypothetical protein
MKEIFANVISRGGYDLEGLLKNIDRYHIEGKLTDEDRDELYDMARKNPEAQYDVRLEIERIWAELRKMQNGGGNADPEQSDEWPEYVQPTGAHDAYQTGAQMTFKGKKCRCLIDNCVWSPDVLPSAWEIVEEDT